MFPISFYLFFFSTEIELTGSPHQIIRQPKGVITSVNCGGPSFHSLEDDIVYISEHSRFASFSYDFNFGKFLLFTLLLAIFITEGGEPLTFNMVLKPELSFS